MNLKSIMEAAQGMQARMQEAQDALDQVMVQGQAGGGMVTITSSAKGRVTRVEIDPSLFGGDDKEVLEDLLVAALNDTRAKAEATSQAEMAKLTQGLPLPPGFKMPF